VEVPNKFVLAAMLNDTECPVQPKDIIVQPPHWKPWEEKFKDFRSSDTDAHFKRHIIAQEVKDKLFWAHYKDYLKLPKNQHLRDLIDVQCRYKDVMHQAVNLCPDALQLANFLNGYTQAHSQQVYQYTLNQRTTKDGARFFPNAQAFDKAASARCRNRNVEEMAQELAQDLVKEGLDAAVEERIEKMRRNGDIAMIAKDGSQTMTFYDGGTLRKIKYPDRRGSTGGEEGPSSPKRFCGGANFVPPSASK
jgi:hypothetical protein